jgi:hypothetical protein
MLLSLYLSRRKSPMAIELISPLTVDGVVISTINQINELPEELRENLYRELIPEQIFTLFGIDPVTGTNADGEPVVNYICPPDSSGFLLEVYNEPEAEDAVFLLEMTEPTINNMELTFININDPTAPRFDADRDEEGRPTLYGTTLRNLKEEERAMASGLFPGQVRPGLGLFGSFLPRAERFFAALGKKFITLRAFFYYNAILYEKNGFSYIAGKKLMKEIHEGFAPGGPLDELLDGSSVFRQPGLGNTVFGRSWAIHDGILGDGWVSPKMVKWFGVEAGECTFPDYRWA